MVREYFFYTLNSSNVISVNHAYICYDNSLCARCGHGGATYRLARYSCFNHRVFHNQSCAPSNFLMEAHKDVILASRLQRVQHQSNTIFVEVHKHAFRYV